MLELNDQIADRLRPTISEQKIIVGTSDVYASTFLEGILRHFHEKFDRIRTHVICDYSPAIWKQLEEGVIDIAIAQDRPLAIAGEDLSVEPLVWVRAPNSEAYSGRPVPLALFKEGCSDRSIVLKTLGEANIAFTVVSESAHYAGLIAVKAGLRFLSCRLQLLILRLPCSSQSKDCRALATYAFRLGIEPEHITITSRGSVTLRSLISVRIMAIRQSNYHLFLRKSLLEHGSRPHHNQ
ncbi:LysR substrate-binding domain-containing protein [Methylosinus sporium]|nr:LysR substrate-binding domain-containing protein [Methylosinus sporium]